MESPDANERQTIDAVAPHGWDEAYFDTEGGYRSVRFSNGQPNWASINGRRLGRFNVADMLTRLVDDGWQLVETAGGTVGKTFSPATRLRRPVYRFRRPALGAAYRYQDVFCPIPGPGIHFNPHDANQTQGAFSVLAPIIETFLQEYQQQGWERDPYPSAVDPQLVRRLWGGQRVTGVKLRLRKAMDGNDWRPAGPH